MKNHVIKTALQLLSQVLLCAFALAATSTFAAHTATAPAARIPFMRGMNLCGFYGDHLENSTSSDTPTSAQRYADLRAKGFDHIRLPVDFRKFANYDENTGTCTLDKMEWNRYARKYVSIGDVDQILDLAEGAGLYIVLDFHGWFDIDPTDEAQRALFKACWAVVAERYKSRSNKIVFELANEPQTKSYSQLNTLQKETVALIRQTNPTRLILYAVGDSNQPWVLTKAQNPPNYGWVSIPSGDNNLALVIHCYNPGVFTHQGCTWADPSYTNQMRLTDSHRSTLNWDLNQVKIYKDAHAIPIVMNEFNVAHQIADLGDVTEYLRMVTRFCESNNIPWSPWLYFGSGEDQMDVRRRDGGWHDFVMDGLFPDLVPTDAFSTNDYAHALDVSFTGYAGTTALENFPALVKLSEGIRGFSYADFALPNGGDLRFTDASGALVPHEIDTWNTNGVSLVWVKVPSLTASAAITAHYGCARPCVPKVESVWDDNYVGVWHLGDGALPLKDSSNVSRDFTAADGAGIGYAAQGIAGGAVDLGETGNGRGLFAADHDALDGFSAFTIEAWTYQTNHATNAGILSKRKGIGNQVSYYFYDKGTTETIFIVGTGAAAASLGLAPTPELGRWNHQAVTYDAAEMADNTAVYLDGAIVATATRMLGAVTNAAGELCLGNLHSGNTANFPGKIDEVRISRCARSADWLRATHNTIASAAFASYAVRGVAPQGAETP